MTIGKGNNTPDNAALFVTQEVIMVSQRGVRSKCLVHRYLLTSKLLAV